MRTWRLVLAAAALAGCSTFTATPATDAGAAPAPDGGPIDTSRCSKPVPNQIACADFDNGSLTGTWEKIDQRGMGASWTVTSLSDTAPSEPNIALSTIVSKNTDQPHAAVRLLKSVPAKATHTTLSFSIHLDEPTLTGMSDYVSIGEIICGDETVTHGQNSVDGVFLQLLTDPPHPRLQLLVGQNFNPEGAKAIPFDTWTQVNLDVDWNGIATLKIGDDIVTGNVKGMTACATASDWRAVAGLSSNLIATAEYDDITLAAF